ncbi:CTP synthase [Patescibacteria group bacterium]|nr:CTP synthase [Patescibacteria group bacterium]MBP9710455.1 CTP synthase [Patescibacteria group bacterium]
MKRRRTYVFIAGGVMSGVGKGIASASLGALLKARGLRVTAVKIDPYINVDAGTMNPVEHGEVFVTSDGDETDQDIGNYERFLDEDITRVNYMTTGRVYLSVIERERALGYGGKTVEVVPHVPLEIIGRIKTAAKLNDADVTIIEIGGTVGEYQNVLYLEAARMMKSETPGDVLVGLVSYLPIPGALGEMKSKPTQYAVRTLNGTGIQPDFIIGRSTHPIDKPRKEKIAINCSMLAEDVISAPDVSSIYQVPLNLEQEGLAERVIKKLKLRKNKVDLTAWQGLWERVQSSTKPIKIGIVGKYVSTGDFVLTDAYLSVLEAVKHAAWSIQRKPEIVWINSEELEMNPKSVPDVLKNLDGILVPGGFGTRGIEGKLLAIRYAREKKVPYLGLCYGLQLATVEFARNVLGLKDANTTEINPKTSNPVIHLMNEQEERMKNKHYGGTMRLGSYDCLLRPGSKAQEVYGQNEIVERHRHRYECNPDYREDLEKAGLIPSGLSPDGSLVEIVELKNHPFFMASQFHPEFLSRPFRPHPMFVGFVKAAAR